MREKLGQLVADVTAARSGAEHLHVRRELRQELTAGAAWGRPVLAVGVDRDPPEAPLPFTDRLDAGSPLRTDGIAQGRVLHIAAGIHASVHALQRRTHREVGIRDIGVHRSLPCHIHQFPIRHLFSPSSLFQINRPVREPVEGIAEIRLDALDHAAVRDDLLLLKADAD